MDRILTTQEMEETLGANVRQLRLHKNLSMETLTEQAGVSLTALKNLEGGKGATIKTLMRVLRTLGKEDWLAALAPVASINPLHMVKVHQSRQRASGKRGGNAIEKT